MTRHLEFGEPVEAVARDGIVCIFVDPETARDLGNAWEFTYATGGLNDTLRPTYLLDVAVLKRAAAEADAQNGDGAEIRYVPIEQPRRAQLRIVGGTD